MNSRLHYTMKTEVEVEVEVEFIRGSTTKATTSMHTLHYTS